MYNLLGFLVAVFFIRTAMQALQVDAEVYLDEVAGLIVLGGTLAAMIISFPARFLLSFLKAPFKMAVNKKRDYQYSIEILVKASERSNDQRVFINQLLRDPKIDSFLKEGLELILLDLKRDDFKQILSERIFRARQRDDEPVDLFRRLAKYPPAFGLVGTVLGLISLMRAVGEGANAAQIGINMALALIATLYGLALSNFVLAPIAENFQSKAEDNQNFRELLREGLIMLFDKTDSLATQEMLNSYLDPSRRLDVLGIHQKESA